MRLNSFNAALAANSNVDATSVSELVSNGANVLWFPVEDLESGDADLSPKYVLGAPYIGGFKPDGLDTVYSAKIGLVNADGIRSNMSLSALATALNDDVPGWADLDIETVSLELVAPKNPSESDYNLYTGKDGITKARCSIVKAAITEK